MKKIMILTSVVLIGLCFTGYALADGKAECIALCEAAAKMMPSWPLLFQLRPVRNNSFDFRILLCPDRRRSDSKRRPPGSSRRRLERQS